MHTGDSLVLSCPLASGHESKGLLQSVPFRCPLGTSSSKCPEPTLSPSALLHLRLVVPALNGDVLHPSPKAFLLSSAVPSAASETSQIHLLPFKVPTAPVQTLTFNWNIAVALLWQHSQAPLSTHPHRPQPNVPAPLSAHPRHPQPDAPAPLSAHPYRPQPDVPAPLSTHPHHPQPDVPAPLSAIHVARSLMSQLRSEVRSRKLPQHPPISALTTAHLSVYTPTVLSHTGAHPHPRPCCHTTTPLPGSPFPSAHVAPCVSSCYCR